MRGALRGLPSPVPGRVTGAVCSQCTNRPSCRGASSTVRPVRPQPVEEQGEVLRVRLRGAHRAATSQAQLAEIVVGEVDRPELAVDDGPVRLAGPRRDLERLELL